MADGPIMLKQDIVFTALFGQYETLNELTISRHSRTRYICFTDDPSLESETWEVILIKSDLPDNPSRGSRAVKMLGHKYFPLGTRSLYVDNTVRLKVDGSIVLDTWLASADIAFMQHSSRRTVRDEFFVCAAYGLDDQSKIWDQFRHYREHFSQVLMEKPHWGGMIARVNTPKTDEFMETWKHEFDVFTKRDQLSINVSSIISGVQIGTINAENDLSVWHEWPIESNRKTEMRDTTSGKRLRKLRIIANAFIYGLRYYLPNSGNTCH